MITSKLQPADELSCELSDVWRKMPHSFSTHPRPSSSQRVLIPSKNSRFSTSSSSEDCVEDSYENMVVNVEENFHKYGLRWWRSLSLFCGTIHRQHCQ